MAHIYVNIKADEKYYYTNVGYREKHNKNGEYIGGIKKELYSVIDNKVLEYISENIKNVAEHAYTPGNLESQLTSEIGIGLQVANWALAEKILERAKHYCPVDTGNLRDSGRVVQSDSDNSCLVVFDASYAWFVHEFTWRNIISTGNPYGIHKFLEVAYQEIMKEEGFR